MIINLYTYKGSKKTLVGPWITAGYLLDHNIDYEDRIPGTKCMFVNHKSVERYNDILMGKIDIRALTSVDINISGDLGVYNNERRILTYAKAEALAAGEELVINRITKPSLWYERLTVIYAVFCRQEYLRRNSSEGYDLLKLEYDFDKHIELLLTYKYLPPMYIWEKAMQAVHNIYPKPRWWHTELKALRSITNESN